MRADRLSTLTIGYLFTPVLLFAGTWFRPVLALPALRAAFADFPPRERGAIAERVAPLLGLPPAQRGRLLQLGPGAQALLDAKRIEAQALAWASAHEVLA